MKLPPSAQKLRGGYYTPQSIARFLCDWAIRFHSDNVLEPSCGDGNILLEAQGVISRLPRPKSIPAGVITGVEFEAKEATRCRQRAEDSPNARNATDILNEDFFSFCKDAILSGRKFDAIVGNPPFIRFQNFPENQREVAMEIMRGVGLRPTRLMNSWVAFLVGATRLLSGQGRMAMIIPAELLQVNYAAEARKFLSDAFSRITLVTFKRLVFEGIQQEVVLLLAEKNGAERVGIRTVELENADNLLDFRWRNFATHDTKPIDHSKEKWTQYFLTTEEILLLRKLKADTRIKRVSELASVDVGIVTGLNEFFVVNQDVLRELSGEKHSLPVVARSPQLNGIHYSKSDWKANAEDNMRAFLLDLPDVPHERLPSALRRYIIAGENQGHHEGYKCRIRARWYVVPSVWTPDAFMLRQIHRYPKVILNGANATCTDTIHRVRFNPGTNRKAFATSFLNSMTFAFSEVLGRSYGGGVLELEPREAEALPIPTAGADKLDWEHTNKLILAGDIDPVLDINDDVLLRAGLSLQRREVKMLRAIWKKLRDRRNFRR